jgi:hypothetical protein
MLLAANISGASISYHFCGKKFQYSAFNGQKKKSKCCCNGTQKKKGCCKTNHCKVKVDDGKVFAKKAISSNHFAIVAIVEYAFPQSNKWVILFDDSFSFPIAHSPPFVRTVPIYLQYRQFLI